MPLKIWNGSAWNSGSAIKIWNGSAWVSASTGKVWNGSAWQQFFGGYTVNSGTGSNYFNVFGNTVNYYFSGWSSVSEVQNNLASGLFPSATMGSISPTPIVVNGATVVAVYGRQIDSLGGPSTGYVTEYTVVVSGVQASGTINTITIDGTLYNSTPTRGDWTTFNSSVYTSFTWSVTYEPTKFNSSTDSVIIT